MSLDLNSNNFARFRRQILMKLGDSVVSKELESDLNLRKLSIQND